MSKRLFKSTSVVVFMTMLSRIFGFVRDVVTAAFFGAAAGFDAFAVAFKIPNFMRRLFAEGSFSQAFVPVLSEYQKNKKPEEVQQFVNSMTGSLAVVLLGVTIFGVVFAPFIVRIFAPGFEASGDRYDLAVTMLRITFPYLMFISLTAFSGSILNTYSRYWVAAFTPVLLNISLISAAIFLAPNLKTPITALAWGVFVAGLVQMFFQIPFLRNLKMMPKPRINFKDPGVRKVLKLMIPALFGVSVTQINLLMDTVFASFLVVGSVSWLYYSDRLMGFPLGVFGVAISTVILPYLSRHHASKSKLDFSLTLDWALRWVLLIGIPAAILLGLLSGPMLATLFQYGKFDDYDVLMAQKSLIMFAVGLTPFMLIKILASGFYARQNLKTPVKIGAVAMVANIIFNLILIVPLAHAGIALSTSLAAILNTGLLFYFLKKDEIYAPRSGWGFFSFRLLFANSLLIAWVIWQKGDISAWLNGSIEWRVTHLVYLLLTSGVLYLGGLFIAGLRPRDVLIEADGYKLSG